ncbi:2OG-Fe(II) oxygenase [Engelhardtia mirabilis]|uniref:Fe2OG dioxygenase domain-containing protein n=1 Tax=Engelhardtia mirabilis TaxID=2528011 RepID=A0A518BMR2_9BACT|nr:hypothetical protein Pla133_33670 [Planctomycetes bacterium Pla133]QDV02597.1 hypothetical protein Pla86_33660 [Planctomycetes bacterium Pla86]
MPTYAPADEPRLLAAPRPSDGQARSVDGGDSSGERGLDPGDEGDPPAFGPDQVAGLGRGQALVFDRVLGSAAAALLAAELRAMEGSLQPAAVGRSERRLYATDVRSDWSCWLDRPEGADAGPLWRLFDVVAGELRDRAWLGMEGVEVQLALYRGDSPGYLRHRDAFVGRGRRRATAIYYLNPNWRVGDGGELQLFDEDGLGSERDVQPVLDRLVVFLSDRLEHAVRPCVAPRWAVTAWFLGPESP